MTMKLGDIVVMRNIYGAFDEFILGEVISDVVWKGEDFHLVSQFLFLHYFTLFLSILTKNRFQEWEKWEFALCIGIISMHPTAS
jgi:hypothetical protein